MRRIISIFFIWRIFLLIVLFFSFSTIALKINFLGGGLYNYLLKPYLFSWANFDGEHYLVIARDGYKSLTYFFFPVYPLITRWVTIIFNKSTVGYILSGLFVSHLSFLIALIGLKRLLSFDYKNNLINITILLIVLFPTSFYFASFYTESLFLMTTVWSFYLARKGNWLFSGIFGAVSTATRITGIALVPALFFEAYLQRKSFNKSNIFRVIIAIVLIPLGLITYMLYLKNITGDPLIFFNNLNQVFGEQRSQTLILLPQVIYRYMFKILPNISYSYLPVVFTTYLEFIAGIAFLFLSLISFFKIRLSYAIYLFFGYMIPTFSGSFSSLPRYVVVLFPAFLVLSLYISRFSFYKRYLIYTMLVILLGFATALFVRGYWIS